MPHFSFPASQDPSGPTQWPVNLSLVQSAKQAMSAQGPTSNCALSGPVATAQLLQQTSSHPPCSQPLPNASHRVSLEPTCQQATGASDAEAEEAGQWLLQPSLAPAVVPMPLSGQLAQTLVHSGARQMGALVGGSKAALCRCPILRTPWSKFSQLDSEQDASIPLHAGWRVPAATHPPKPRL